MEVTKVYPLDAVYDNPEDVPEDVIKSFTYCFWNNLHNVKLYSPWYSWWLYAGKNKQTLFRILKMDCSGIICCKIVAYYYQANQIATVRLTWSNY